MMSSTAQYLATLLLLFCFFHGVGYSQSSGKPYLGNYSVQKVVVARNGGVSSAHPLASKVGVHILQQGGNAVDAAIAVQLALAVVDSSAGNIGGGGFMVMHLADGRNLALDFREKAPASARRDMYLDSAGKPVVEKSLAGHLASGVPGTIAGIFASMRYAKLPFAKLIQPAIDLAETGYMLTARNALFIGVVNPKYSTRPNVFDGSRRWQPGDVFKQPDLANTLKRIRDNGRKEFYEGKTARLIVDEMRRGGGNITMEDLKNYQVQWREPHTFSYRGYSIVSMPLPSSGGILLNQMLKMIEPFPIASYGYGSAQAVNLMIEAERRVYRDRAAYLGDGDFSDIPVAKLTSDAYLKEQMADYVAGKMGVSQPIGSGKQQPESQETTHLSIVDKYGNAVAVTTTLNMAFGSQVVVGGAGFFLNNEMNDFSLKPGVPNASGGIGGVANSIEPGKRMLSSMTPTIVLKNGQLSMVLGAPGGTTIPTSVLQTIVNIIDFQMTSADAVSKPRFHHEWMPDVIFTERNFSEESKAALKTMGYTLRTRPLGEVELIRVRGDGNLDIIADARGMEDSAEGY